MTRRRRPPRAGALTELPPLKILTQIVLLQTAYYTSAFTLILFTALVAGKRFTLDLVLSWRSLRGDTAVGWMLGLVWMFNSLVGVTAILILVHRSKLVLDFALTLHFIHLIAVSFYSGSLPRNFLWWILQVSSAAIMTFLGIWSCQWRELQPINLGSNSSTMPNGTEIADSNERPDSGGSIARERGRDSTGEYEMVGVNNEDSERLS